VSKKPNLHWFSLYAHPGYHVRAVLWSSRNQMNVHLAKRGLEWNDDCRACFVCGDTLSGS
jgi:hypothetical protein